MRIVLILLGLGLLLLILCPHVHATITLSNGSFQDAQGNPVANGTIVFILSTPAEVTSTPSGQIVTTTPIMIPLDSNGNVVGTPAIYSNAELTPTGTWYSTQVYSSSGSALWPQAQIWIFNQPQGTTVNLSTMIPTAPNGPTYPTNPAGNNFSTTGSGPVVQQSNALLTSPTITGGLNVDTMTVTGSMTTGGAGTILSSAPGNTDMFGIIALSSGTGSYTFQGTYANPPVCEVQDPANHTLAFTTTTTTLSITGGTGSDSVNYHCFGALPFPLNPSNTFALQTANNTSACSSATYPTYCTAALPALVTNPANTGAQTTALTPIGHVSQMKLSSYLFSGATTQFIAAYQPWFGMSNCWHTPFAGSSAHPCIGMSENNAAVVAQQHSTMLARGFSIVSPDWYGNSSSQTFINQTVINEAADLAGRCNGSICPLKMMIMVDNGLISGGMSNAAACNTQASTDQTTCIETVLKAAWDYIDANWGRKNYYATDSTSGQPITLVFIGPADFSSSACNSTCLANVWANVKAHMSTYATPYKIIKQFGDFSTTNIDGAYGWPQSETYSAAGQLCWQDLNCSGGNYFGRLYTQAQAAPTKIMMGLLFPGFDGSNNNYNNKVTARQCGQLLYLQSQYATTTGTGFTLYSASNQMPYMIVPTWNDYGEATNVEDGVDNCYTVTNSGVSSGTLSWTLNKTDATYASSTTIDHMTIWYADASGNLYLALDNIPPATTSKSVAALIPTGTWTVYVEMVGKPLIINRMSNGTTYTH